MAPAGLTQGLEQFGRGDRQLLGSEPGAIEPLGQFQQSRITAALHRSAEDGITDTHQLQQVVRRTVGRWVNDAYRRRPMIVPTVRRGLSDE